MAAKNNPEQAADTGHSWDGIRELTNPPPRWWMVAFHASWIWCIVYFVLYPSIPLVHSSTKGILGWTSVKEYKEAVAENNAIKAPYLKKLSAMSGQDILKDQELLNFSESAAKAVFGDNCAPCHGSGGQGTPGLFPNLADDDWLYGGDINTIIETIHDGRQGNMPAFSIELADREINKLADFVMALPQGKASEEGWALFNSSGCTGCHGDDARGQTFVGSANLTDQIWRFGGTREEVLRTIRYGVNQDDVENTRVAIMPSFGEKLSNETIKLLAVKVYSFGGGK